MGRNDEVTEQNRCKRALSEIEFNKQVGEKLKSLRNILGLSQVEMATCLKVSYQQVQKYESGINALSLYRIYLLQIQFNIPTKFLFEEITQLVNSIN